MPGGRKVGMDTKTGTKLIKRYGKGGMVKKNKKMMYGTGGKVKKNKMGKCK